MRALMCWIGAAAVFSLPVCVVADDIQYWPNGDTAAAPYYWTTAANWAEKVKSPSASLERVPTSSDAVYLAADELSSSPLVITNGDSITVASLVLAAGDNNSATPNNLYGKGQGTRLKVSPGGTLSTTGAFILGKNNYQWGVLDLEGTVNVGGDMILGQDNAYATTPSLVDVSPGAALNVVGALRVGNRTQRGLTVVTNAGTVVAGSLIVGPDNNSYISHGSFCNAEGGSLSVSGVMKVLGDSGGSSSAEFYLKEGSTFTYSGSDIEIGVGKGMGLMESEISTDFSAVSKFYIGNGGSSSTGMLRLAKSAYFKAKSLSLPYMQYGTGILRLEGASVMDVSNITASVSGAKSHLELTGNASITNVNMIYFGAVSGTRVSGGGRISMDGSSKIVFNPNAADRTIMGGSQSNGWLNVTLAGSSAITGLKTLCLATGSASGNGGTYYLYSRGAELTLAGGTISFDLASASGTFQLGAGGSTTTMRPVVHMHGYGTVTRDDIADLTAPKSLSMTMPCPVWSVTADGGGEMRDLDLRAVAKANGAATYGNKSGTNGWFAVSKGRLLYPRAYQLQYVSKNPVRGIGEFPDLGTDGVPTLINSATVRVPSNFAAAYLYAALYATDRSDVPGGIPVGDGATIAVWRLGLAEAWKDDDPASPKAFSDLPFTFCYDVRDIPDDAKIEKVCLWRHDGSAGGSWRRLATVRPEVDAETGAKTWPNTITATLSSCDQTWNGGFIAIGAPTRCGAILVVR